MDLSTLNWLAIVVSELVFFGLGGIGKLQKKANMPKVMVLTLLFSFILALNLALLQLDNL